MSNTKDTDRLELSRLLEQAKLLLEPLYPDQLKQWAAESPLAQEISALLAKHPEYYDEIHAQVGGLFAKPGVDQETSERHERGKAAGK